MSVLGGANRLALESEQLDRVATLICRTAGHNKVYVAHLRARGPEGSRRFEVGGYYGPIPNWDSNYHPKGEFPDWEAAQKAWQKLVETKLKPHGDTTYIPVMIGSLVCPKSLFDAARRYRRLIDVSDVPFLLKQRLIGELDSLLADSALQVASDLQSFVDINSDIEPGLDADLYQAMCINGADDSVLESLKSLEAEHAMRLVYPTTLKERKRVVLGL